MLFSCTVGLVPSPFGPIVGVDEAGRGPVLGPLVLAAVMLDAPAARALRRLGVKDSKAFGHGPEARRQRALLAREVHRRARWVRERVAPAQLVDERARRGQLNHLERELALEMLTSAGVVTSAADGPLFASGLPAGAGPRPRIVFDGRLVFGDLADQLPDAVAVDGAEDSWVAVAAASVVAKRRRDTLYALIARRIRSQLGLRHGEEPDPMAGAGYINRTTARMIEVYVERHGCFPPETRHSWSWSHLVELRTRFGLPAEPVKQVTPKAARRQLVLL
jgi:ribonuclease HII